MAFQTQDVVQAMRQDTGLHLPALKVDGGASVNDRLMQFQADVLQANTIRPKIVETTVMGAAFLAGLAVGYWKDTAEISGLWESDRVFQPGADPKVIEAKIRGWKRAVAALESWSRSTH